MLEIGLIKTLFLASGGTHQVSTNNLIGRVGKFNVILRRDRLASHAGLLLVREFAERLGVSALLDEELRVKQRQRGYSEGEAILGLCYNLIAGGSALADLDVLRGDPGTCELLGVETVLAPTTAGEYLRKFHLGGIKDLQRSQLRLQERVRPRQPRRVCTMDLDSSIYEQASEQKQGSNKAYNGEVGYHPLFAFWDETGELLFSHLRRGSAYTSKKAIWFLEETWKCVPTQAQKKLRADSGFYSHEVVEWCEARGVEFGITADQTQPLMSLIRGVAEQEWEDLERYGVAQVAEVRYRPTRWQQEYRYVVKRNLVETKAGKLEFRYHVLVTNNEDGTAAAVLEWHLRHANMENRIKEHKSGFSLEKLPTGRFHANWAYLLIGQLAFNLMQWFKQMVLPKEYQEATMKTIRHQVLNLAGKIVRTGRQKCLVISEHYRYQKVWKKAVRKLERLSFA